MFNWLCKKRTNPNNHKDEIDNKPKLTVPESTPLSPCIIEPYVNNDGVVEENKAYIPVSLLIKAIDDDRIHNIAVAGNYGVGKSSIINTAEDVILKEKDNKHKFIKISLASLLIQENKEKSNKEIDEANIANEVDSNDKPKTVDNNVTDKQIEYSILQQILYHECPQNTPKSRIRRIHRTRPGKPLLISLIIIIAIFALLIAVKPSWAHVSDYYSMCGAKDWVKTLEKWGPIVILVGTLVLLCRYIGHHFSLSISHIGFKDMEMKIKDEMSIFNAYLDEIVYFFESTDYDVVVFEDLDRFADKEVIFYKLRELNTILNNCQSLDRRIVFVYAVLDHLFDSTERVKFFDYIVTVIPVVNSLNSYDKLKESIKPKELFEKLGRNELHNLCDYLQDMRLLLNIVNEFNQFSPLLDRSIMTDKVLFGLVVYKNYIPSDFSLMYNRAGVVATALDKVDENRNVIIQDLNNNINELKSEIQKTEKGRDDELVRLRTVFLETGKALLGFSSINPRIKIGENLYLQETVIKDDTLFQKIKNGQASFVTNSGTYALPNPSSIDANMGGSGYYDKTAKDINQKCEDKVNDIKRRIQSNTQEIAMLPNTVVGAYKKNITLLDKELDGIKEQDKKDLVKFLILNGYIDQNYQYYISYFYPNSLKLVDRNFVMRAARHEGMQFEAKLSAIDEVLKRFTPEDVSSNISILNVDIVREVFRDSQYKSYREPICKVIATNNSVEFILVAYKSNPSIPVSFYSQLLKYYDFWNTIEEQEEYEQDILREIYLKYCDVKDGRVDNRFVPWLSDNYSFIDNHIDRITSKRLIELFKCYSPVFTTLTFTNTPVEILREIIDNKRFRFDKQNFDSIVKELGFFEKYRKAAYTSLREEGHSALLKMVESNWPVFLSFVVPNTSVFENDYSQIVILKASVQSKWIDKARSYLSKQKEHIKNTELLDDGLLEYAYDNSLVSPTWRNVYYYCEKKGSIPITFLYNNIFYEKVNEYLSHEEEEILCRKLVFSDILKLTSYNKLVPLFTTPFNEIYARIQPARMMFLISNKLLVFNEKNYKFIRDNYNLSEPFIINNIDEFLRSPELFEFDSTEAMAVINKLPTKKAKCDFIRSIKDINITPDDKMAMEVGAFVLSGDLNVTEIGTQLLIAIISVLPTPQRIIVGRRAILSLPYSNDLVTDILKAMDGEYKRFLSDSSYSMLSYSRDAILIANYLAEKEFIRKVDRKNGKLLIYKNNSSE